jgi:hypothetical protein
MGTTPHADTNCPFSKKGSKRSARLRGEKRGTPGEGSPNPSCALEANKTLGTPSPNLCQLFKKSWTKNFLVVP